MMAAQILKTGRQSWTAGARDGIGVPREAADDEALSLGRAAAAFGVAAAAMLLAGAPAVIAIVALVNPGELDRALGWLVGGSFAFSLVAAGRVPAAALLALALAGRRIES
jgi:hypothetical protein